VLADAATRAAADTRRLLHALAAAARGRPQLSRAAVAAALR
jgi:hypothetical protein